MSAAGWDNVPEQPLQEPSVQFKVGEERIELAMKIEKLKSFMTTNPKFKELDYYQARLLEDQLVAMNSYESILVQRLILLNKPNQD